MARQIYTVVLIYLAERNDDSLVWGQSVGGDKRTRGVGGCVEEETTGSLKGCVRACLVSARKRYNEICFVI